MGGNYSTVRMKVETIVADPFNLDFFEVGRLGWVGGGEWAEERLSLSTKIGRGPHQL